MFETNVMMLTVAIPDINTIASKKRPQGAEASSFGRASSQLGSNLNGATEGLPAVPTVCRPLGTQRPNARARAPKAAGSALRIGISSRLPSVSRKFRPLSLCCFHHDRRRHCLHRPLHVPAKPRQPSASSRVLQPNCTHPSRLPVLASSQPIASYPATLLSRCGSFATHLEPSTGTLPVARTPRIVCCHAQSGSHIVLYTSRYLS
jgi:hypothetical protein